MSSNKKRLEELSKIEYSAEITYFRARLVNILKFLTQTTVMILECRKKHQEPYCGYIDRRERAIYSETVEP